MLSKKFRLTKRGSFSYVYRKGESVGAGAFRMLYVKSGSLKIGVAVGCKIGKAVVRNKVKRRLRAILRGQLKNIRSGYQIVFVAKPQAAELDYKRMEREISGMLKRAGMV